MCQTKRLQTASIPQVPRTASAHLGNLQPALNYLMPIKSLQTASKTLLTTFKKLANSFYSPSAKNCFSTSMPAYNLLSITLCESKACKLLQFTSAKKLANRCQFTSAKQKLTNSFNSQISRPCKLLPIHKWQTKVCHCQNQSLQIALIHKCQELVSWCQPTNAKQKLAHSFNSQVPRPYKLLPINMCPTKPCPCQW